MDVRNCFRLREHDMATPPCAEIWYLAFTPDTFSVYRAGFDIRICRLCKRVLTYHHFTEVPGDQRL